MKFLISGVSAAAIEYGSFLALQYVLGENNLVISQTLSYLAGFLVSFSLNKWWVFKSTGNTGIELVKYVILLLVNLVITNVVLGLLVDQLNVAPWIAKIVVMAMVAGWNYFIFQKIIFKPKSVDQDK